MEVIQIASNYGKYFKQEEFTCKCGCGGCDISQNLVNKLNTVREILGKPIKINSGFRCEDHNRKIGGSATSSHLRGLAVDIRANESSYRHELLKVLYFVGFNRIGIDETFIHVDIDDLKPQKVTFLY